MTTTTAGDIGTTARFDLESGDSYIGEIATINGDLVTLTNYSAWYAGSSAPCQTGYADDQVRFRVDNKTVVSPF